MITSGDFHRIMGAAGRPDQGGYPSQEHAPSWWTGQGVDYEALTEWCTLEGKDNAEVQFPEAIRTLRGAGVPGFLIPGAAVASVTAMATEIGFAFGWLLHAKATR